MKKTVTTEQLETLIEEGGIGNALALVEASAIIDPELAKLWVEADVAITRIEVFINIRLERV